MSTSRIPADSNVSATAVASARIGSVTATSPSGRRPVGSVAAGPGSRTAEANARILAQGRVRLDQHGLRGALAQREYPTVGHSVECEHPPRGGVERLFGDTGSGGPFGVDVQAAARREGNQCGFERIA